MRFGILRRPLGRQFARVIAQRLLDGALKQLMRGAKTSGGDSRARLP